MADPTIELTRATSLLTFNRDSIDENRATSRILSLISKKKKKKKEKEGKGMETSENQASLGGYC